MSYQKIVNGFFLGINAVISLIGIALFSMGCYMLTRADPYQSFFEKSSVSLPAFAIIVGMVLSTIFIVGLCGNVKKNFCMTVSFSTVMSFVLLLVVGCAAAAYLLDTTIDNGRLEKDLDDSLTRYNVNGTNGTDYIFWTQLQGIAHCCGVNGSSDYPHWNMTIPTSCCINGANCTTTNSTQVFTDGCYPIVKGELGAVTTIFNLSIGVSVFVLVLIVGNSYLAHTYRREGYESV